MQVKLKQINYNIIKNIAYKYPNTIVKNNNIFNNNTKDSKVLYKNNIEYYILKPKGKKSQLWFTYFEKKIICILIILNNNKIFSNENEFYEYKINVNNNIYFNNVLIYGYYFNQQNQSYFVLDNVLNYNVYNKYISHDKYNNQFKVKLKLFSLILENYSFNNNHKCNLVLPIILDKLDKVFKIINKIQYKLYSISLYSDNKYFTNYILNNNYNKNNYIFAAFKVTANLESDIYNLYINNNNLEEFYDYALINTFELSKFMNKLFRKIKENNNLDYLLESDSEEEFENIDLYKFVNREKSFIFDCYYNQKFKKWVPQKISNKKNPIDKKNLIPIISKKKYFYNI